MTCPWRDDNVVISIFVALQIVKEENKPRFKSIEWYGHAIDFDMNKAIEIINKAPRLYKRLDKRKTSVESDVSIPEEPPRALELPWSMLKKGHFRS